MPGLPESPKMLKIYNSLAREKQDFVPIEAGKVRMYVCGMTVYDYCHLGHARVLVVFDMVQRWLRAGGRKGFCRPCNWMIGKKAFSRL